MIDNLVIVEEEEHLLFQNRTADGPPEVVVAKKWKRPKLGTWSPKFIGPRIECVVLPVIVPRSVELVGTPLGDLVDDHSADPVLRRERRQGDLKFVHSFKDGGVGILTMRKRSRCAVGQNVAVGQVAVGRHAMARIGRSLITIVAATPRSTGKQDHEVFRALGDLGQL